MISREQARSLSSKPEFELVEQSYPPAIEDLSSVGLRDRISRSRDLYDKYRGAAAAPGEASEQKAQLFEETRQRFEERLESLGDSYPG